MAECSCLDRLFLHKKQCIPKKPFTQSALCFSCEKKSLTNNMVILSRALCEQSNYYTLFVINRVSQYLKPSFVLTDLRNTQSQQVSFSSSRAKSQRNPLKPSQKRCLSAKHTEKQ